MAMTVGQLKRLLEHFDDDMEVYYQKRPTLGNVDGIYYVSESYYAFFGNRIPCVMLDNDIPQHIDQSEKHFVDAISDEITAQNG